jgi:hypothetical protein
VPIAPLSAWQQKGATSVPPPSVVNASLNGILTLNQTGGAVSDADARQWAIAVVRTNAYDVWAENNLQDQFLVRSGLSGTPTTIFAFELTRIAQARARGARIEATAPMVRRLALRPVASSLRQTIQEYGMSWSPYAFYMDQVGPSDLVFVGADGSRTSQKQDRVASGQAVPLLVGGQFQTDAVLGPVWTLTFDADCSSSASRAHLGALCSP